MPRWLLTTVAVVLVACWGATIALTAGKGTNKPGKGTYLVELDNAFGLTDGSDVKLGGVRAGIIQSQRLDQRTRRAIISIKLTAPGFDSLRRDAFCQVRPQSLIGEYFLDCQPGKGAPLERGGLIPVEQTGSAIGFDLLNVALRRPNNERLRLLLGELGAGVAARGPEINAALRRALPALRETNRVLRVLAQENQTLARLVRNGDRALSDVADRRAEVARFVKEAGRTSAISARRRGALREQWRRYPGFLDQLEPSMRDLGTASDAQAGALHELRAGATRLRTFFDRLGAFSQASRPSINALGRAAQAGRKAAVDAKPALGELQKIAAPSPELARNAAITLEHLYNRDNAVEPDPRSPGGKGYNGIEALLQFAFNQTLAVNVFNAQNHFLKVNLENAPGCGKYANVKVVKENPGCNSYLGPNQPGINQPPFWPADEATKRSAPRHHRARRHHRAGEHPAAASPSAPGAPSSPAPKTPDVKLPPLPELPKLPDLPPLPGGIQAPDPNAQRGAQDVLDYLLGP